MDCRIALHGQLDPPSDVSLLLVLARVCAVLVQCWVLMSAAVKVIHGILTRDFGFEHIMWIFSGRRGVHW
jgi:DNA primase catalytic subunit